MPSEEASSLWYDPALNLQSQALEANALRIKLLSAV